MALIQERAELRSKVVEKESIYYDFHICLQKGDSYQGYTEISFKLISLPHELPLDFKGKNVLTLIQNGKPIEFEVEDGFLLLDPAELKLGDNRIGVHYLNKYDNDGSGCLSFVDTDLKQYVSTQFAPYYANRVFPCFDQPDLKAKMKLSVLSPKDWKKVISNQTALVEEQFVEEKYRKITQCMFPEELGSYLKNKVGKMSIFPQTKLMSTYLFCLVGGEYVELKLEEEKLFKNISMSLYCIESLYPYMKEYASFIFEVIIQSMKFYEHFFNYPFSFNKYDQIFAHEYKWGAMENSGAVIINDKFLPQEKRSTEFLLNWATTMSHQLSHHWFGNLVTMKWWDDLWLNQTFATFISYLCMEKIKDKLKTISYQSSMTSFFQSKSRGYYEDQMITTHPIRGKVPNTRVADSIFDGITYQKGAATMKQFCYLMGEDNFSRGLSDYFHKYAWSNATIDDFLAHMQVYFKITEFTLTEWKELWLQKASLNILSVNWNSQDLSSQAKMKINQQVFSQKFDTLRMHKIKVGLFKEDLQIDSLEVLLQPQSETIINYDGSKGYKAILLNFQDHDFVKILIDTQSLDFFGKNITMIEDTLSRQMIWDNFYQLTYNGKMTSIRFVEIIKQSLSKESSDNIFSKILDNVQICLNKYTPEKFRNDLNTQMFNFIYTSLAQTPIEQENRVTILKSQLVKYGSTQEEINRLIAWKNNQDPLLQDKPMTLGQKWITVSKAFTLPTLSLQQKEAMFDEQKQLDPSDTAKNYRYMCDALKSTPEEYEQIYQSFKEKDSKLSVEAKRYLAAGWNSGYHRQRLTFYRSRYFSDIPKLATVLTGDHYEAFYSLLAPIDDDLQSQIMEFQKINLGSDQEKHIQDLLKMINLLRSRLKVYKVYRNCDK